MRRLARVGGPRSDVLGSALLTLHLAIGLFILLGWALPSQTALLFYVAFVPTVMMQWVFNRGTCIINNLETCLRTGRWRDPSNPEEAGFVRMLGAWWFGLCLSRGQIDAISYSVSMAVWLLGIVHLNWLAA